MKRIPPPIVPPSATPEPGTSAPAIDVTATVAAVLRALGAGGVVGDPILTRDQASEVLNLSVRTLLRLAERREGPPIVRLSPRRVGYRLNALTAWAEAQAQHGQGGNA